MNACFLFAQFLFAFSEIYFGIRGRHLWLEWPLPWNLQIFIIVEDLPRLFASQLGQLTLNIELKHGKSLKSLFFLTIAKHSFKYTKLMSIDFLSR